MKNNIFERKIFWVILFGVTTIVFVLYMFFLSDNNLSKRRELDKNTANLEKSIKDTKAKTENNYSFNELKNDTNKLEQYGREKLNMQKADEDVFVIVQE